MKIKKKSILKTAKGYRLKNSTHNLVEKIQILINGSKDTVISRALKLYYNHLNNESNISNKEIKTSKTK